MCGSNRKIAGKLYGPMPILVDAATLTEYITPEDKLANSNDGVAASTVMFVRIFDILCESNPLTIT